MKLYTLDLQIDILIDNLYSIRSRTNVPSRIRFCYSSNLIKEKNGCGKTVNLVDLILVLMSWSLNNSECVIKTINSPQERWNVSDHHLGLGFLGLLYHNHKNLRLPLPRWQKVYLGLEDCLIERYIQNAPTHRSYIYLDS